MTIKRPNTWVLYHAGKQVLTTVHFWLLRDARDSLMRDLDLTPDKLTFTFEYRPVLDTKGYVVQRHRTQPLPTLVE